MALARSHEIKALKESSDKLQTYSSQEVEDLKVGALITLKTYPFENMLVEVMEINLKQKKVKVKIR